MDIKEKNIEAYGKIASDYSQRNFDHFWIDEFDFYKRSINGKKVIDLGCGAGRDASVFVENGFDYLGIDASEEMLKVAKGRVPKGKFQQIDFGKTVFPDSSFDGFWAAASFLHVPKKDIDNILQEANRITKDGGIGFISVKEKTEMDEGEIKEDKFGGISRYFSFYTENEFKDLLERNGFSIVNISNRTENDERKTKWLCYFVKIVK
ncbi:MAG: class I SAM-dependent methyltransferase [Candidatus Pacebacteria bacterium]|nr:class I SAM-dependent methyltransferase [Candidatus Paceibacterota bacterium]